MVPSRRPCHKRSREVISQVRVRVVAHDPLWAQSFALERDRLRGALQGRCIAIHHIGSTAVPGLLAKPIIDIMPVVRHIGDVDSANAAMRALAYECLGEFGIAGRRYFRKGGEEHRSHQVHVYEDGDTNIERHLALRDYLREHADARASYGLLKKRLAEAFPRDIEAYMDGKDAFVKALETKALAWYKARNRSSNNTKGRT